MFQVELNTMVRQEQLRDLVRDAARREAVKKEGREDESTTLERLLVAVPLLVAAAGLVAQYVPSLMYGANLPHD